jgi:O-antigen ligase
VNRHRSLLAPTLALALVTVGGRYSLDRLGISWLAWLDLRLAGLALAFALITFDLRRVRGRGDSRPRAEGWLLASLIFFGYQMASGLWAPPTAAVAENAVDILCMALLTVGFYLHARADPVAVAQRLLWLFWFAAVVFAVGALTISGPGNQGRFAAFGGGPNVFVRIQILGLIAGLALYSIRRWPGFILTPPLFVLSAILSGSRGGLVAGIAVGAAVALRGGRKIRKLATAGTLVAAALTALAYQFDPAVRELVRTRFVDQTLQQGYVSARPQVWSQSIALALDHPVNGAGIDGFRALLGVSSGIAYPHNYVLAVAAEGGAVGLALLAVSVALWIGTLRRTAQGSTELTASVVAAAFVAIASLFSGDYYDSRLAWCFAAVAAALAVSRDPRRAGAADPARDGVLVRHPEHSR